jgi:hypothetical protein
MGENKRGRRTAVHLLRKPISLLFLGGELRGGHDRGLQSCRPFRHVSKHNHDAGDARSGDNLWGAGFGPTSPGEPSGVEVPFGTAYGAALAPGYAGLCEVASQNSAWLMNGDYPVVAGVQSPSAALIIVHD